MCCLLFWPSNADCMRPMFMKAIVTLCSGAAVVSLCPVASAMKVHTKGNERASGDNGYEATTNEVRTCTFRCYAALCYIGGPSSRYRVIPLRGGFETTKKRSPGTPATRGAAVPRTSCDRRVSGGRQSPTSRGGPGGGGTTALRDKRTASLRSPGPKKLTIRDRRTCCSLLWTF